MLKCLLQSYVSSTEKILDQSVINLVRDVIAGTVLYSRWGKVFVRQEVRSIIQQAPSRNLPNNWRGIYETKEYMCKHCVYNRHDIMECLPTAYFKFTGRRILHFFVQPSLIFTAKDNFLNSFCWKYCLCWVASVLPMQPNMVEWIRGN